MSETNEPTHDQAWRTSQQMKELDMDGQIDAVAGKPIPILQRQTF